MVVSNISLKPLITSYLEQKRQEYLQIKKDNPSVYKVIKKLDYFIHDITKDEFNRLYEPHTTKNSFLPNQIGEVFWDYYVKYKSNRQDKFDKSDGVDVDFLTDEEFISKYGAKPWDIVNNILEDFKNLDYRVNNPLDEKLHYMRDSFQLKLTNIRTGVEVNFQDLSSGEKILMALVASMYKTSSDNTFPDVLLLDEIDASLHPSMIKNLLDVIQDVFLKNNMKVIMVTHSPSTIAFSPEESIFVMNKDGEERIEKSSKETALDILTEGFVSLTNTQTRLGISYNIGKTNLPVLFTEGITDKVILETAWEKLYDGKEMPFYIQDAFDALFLANLLKRGDEGSGLFKTHEDRQIIALFDFDGAGYNQWNGLKKFTEIIEENPRLCLTKKHHQENAYVMLLPVSEEVKDNVIRIDNETYKSESSLQIELLFYQVEQVNSFFRDKDIPGGKVIAFFGKKTDFSEQVKGLNKEDFKNFQPLFEKIEKLLSI